ncbi:hypothetical protein HJ01_00903 [Flavobacterium frigoris PS1]|uniref:Uncharacterized protein n=1 Tax=Flavobacterium frigoris (strain PS1) TaxID=1086011 RepID=H7FP05_FLAFP|nr:hypothetical protein HJ01_00903 [Flavobacterium frigoris PS1]
MNFIVRVVLKTTTVYCLFIFSPDGSGILFIFSLKRKRYSEQQEIASNFIQISFYQKPF